MNTFYYLENLEIKEMKTVKDFEFIKAKVNKKAVEKIDDIPVPHGHELNGMVFKETEEYIKEKAIAQAQAELAETDKDIPRGLEDLIDAIDANNVFKKNQTPQEFQDKLADKKAKRQTYLDLLDA